MPDAEPQKVMDDALFDIIDALGLPDDEEILNAIDRQGRAYALEALAHAAHQPVGEPRLQAIAEAITSLSLAAMSLTEIHAKLRE